MASPMSNTQQWFYKGIVLLFGQFRWSSGHSEDTGACLANTAVSQESHRLKQKFKILTILQYIKRVYTTYTTMTLSIYNQEHNGHTLQARSEKTSPTRVIPLQCFLFRVRQEVKQLLLPGSKVGGRCRTEPQLHPQGHGKMRACVWVGVYVFQTLTCNHTHIFGFKIASLKSGWHTQNDAHLGASLVSLSSCRGKCCCSFYQVFFCMLRLFLNEFIYFNVRILSYNSLGGV